MTIYQLLDSLSPNLSCSLSQSLSSSVCRKQEIYSGNNFESVLVASGRFGMKLEFLNQGKDNNGDQLLSGKITSQSFVNTAEFAKGT